MSSLTKQQRKRLIVQLAERDGWVCHYCQKPLIPIGAEDDLCNVYYFPEGPNGEIVKSYGAPEPFAWPTLDHKLARSSGGTHDLTNLALACLICNTMKGHRLSYEEFYQFTARLRGGAK